LTAHVLSYSLSYIVNNNDSFLVFGLVRMDYAALLFVVGIVCTAIGQIGINYLVKKYKRSSIIILRYVVCFQYAHSIAQSNVNLTMLYDRL
jgi:uncharacterized membrane protein YgdD (TMEM256/DUF423 family)